MLLDLWLAAFKSPYGVAIQTDNRMLLRQHLYKARLESDKPELESMMMVLPEQADELWLVHKDADGVRTDNESDVEPV